MSLLPHIWSILLPCIFQGYTVVMRSPALFEYPLSETTGKGAPKDVNNVDKEMGLQCDDVWRLIEMTLMFAVFIPWSLTLLAKNYRWGIVIHRIMYIMFVVDIIRRHSHPHNWVLNGPVFIFWCIDLYVGWHWKKSRSLAERQIVSADYMILHWTSPNTLDTAGPEFLLKLAHTKWSEWRHPFTGFCNRGKLVAAPQAITEPGWDGHYFVIENGCLLRNSDRNTETSNDDIEEWTCGSVLRIYHQESSHTRAMAEDSDPVIDCWGPFEGSMSADVHRRMQNPDATVVVVAGGSGAGYLLDSIQQHMLVGKSPALFLFTTRDQGLFQWFTWMFQTMQERNASQGGAGIANAAKAFTVVALTGKGVAMAGDDLQLTNGIVQLGRLDFMAQFHALRDKKARVYVQGGKGLQNTMKKACDLHGCGLTAGASYDNVTKKANSKEALFNNFSSESNTTSHSTKGLTEKSRVNIVQRARKEDDLMATVSAMETVGAADVPEHRREDLRKSFANPQSAKMSSVRLLPARHAGEVTIQEDDEEEHVDAFRQMSAHGDGVDAWVRLSVPEFLMQQDVVAL